MPCPDPEVTLAIQQKPTTRDLAGIMQAYPTFDDALWNSAIAHAGSTLDQPVVRTAVKLLRESTGGVATGASNHRQPVVPDAGGTGSGGDGLGVGGVGFAGG